MSAMQGDSNPITRSIFGPKGQFEKMGNRVMPSAIETVRGPISSGIETLRGAFAGDAMQSGPTMPRRPIGPAFSHIRQY